VTNRYSVHVVLIALVVFTAGVNISAGDVRAETFGEQTLMYALVTQQDNEIIEEFAATDFALEYSSVQYRETTTLSSITRGVDFTGAGSSTVLVGGSALSAPTISDGAASTADRTDVETYIVLGGDTSSTIAEQFGISLNTLLWANDLSVRSVLKPGKELIILPTSGISHTVKSGDTLSSIAKKYDAESEEVLTFNRLASADDLIVGEQIIVPGGEIQVVTPTRSTTFTSVLSSPTSTVTPTTTSTIAPSTTGSGAMIWPTDLYTITQYYGWRHTGIDIDCHFNNDNYAADYGVVQFSGWKGGYGNAVEVNHGNGIVTRYAHQATNYVVAGQQVVKGQALGRCGTTGRSSGTHIHFEVIVNGSYRNPLEYLR
jgi:LysM repeat protein